MSTTPVFCPKCGQQSTEWLRFCSRCGTNLEAVSKVLTGELPARMSEAVRTEAEIEYARAWSRAIGNLITSIAVFTALMIVIGDSWVWFLLFWIFFAIRDVARVYLLRRTVTDPLALRAAIEETTDCAKKRRKRERRRLQAPAPPPPPVPVVAPPTGELEAGPRDWSSTPPPSVTEATTRQLDEKSPGPRYAPPRSK